MTEIDLRTVMGEFATGVTAVTLNGHDPHGITVNSFTSVSLDPPLVLVCLDHSTEAYDRLASGDADGYCVNILAADQQILGEYFADMAAEELDPFAEFPTTTDVSGAPIFTESLGYVDCSIHETVAAGDHSVVIGRVEGAALLEPDRDALTYYEGEWGRIPSTAAADR